ncbi:stromal cell-derived factor 2 [Spinellus fusiger]|nr:stromal cell-derived factor 2 [Spinellus fusiger]
MKLIWLACLPLALAASQRSHPEIEDGFYKVTCGSTVKLANQVNQHRLHSHGVSYGSGSRQQSVTGFSDADDTNSLWLVRAAYGNQCTRGEPVPCGSTVRLLHVNTKGYLHSHSHTSPLSSQQEVSCYDGQNAGDDWRVVCSQSHWLREEPVQLVHVESQTYLACTHNQYGHPIPGQYEVVTIKSSSQQTYWAVKEGVFFASHQ